ncbi:MAG: hypothetical protein N2112_00510 [Gemmataceae bacterium]|nr:hypothetical protein [Gemmataceae bacterium]
MWDTCPTAADLLRWRLDRGYVPTPSLLKTGPEILGYARCLVPKQH